MDKTKSGRLAGQAMEPIKIIMIILGIVTVAGLFVAVLESKRRLDRRVAEFLREQEESQTPINPYLGLAELYADDERQNEDARRKKKGRA